jgi:cobalt-zinc-cadmium efflux system protein
MCMPHRHDTAAWGDDRAQASGARRRLALVLGITFVLMIVEAVGGILTGSLALLADAGHMLADVGALGLALFAAWFSSRRPSPRNTFGYQRLEILAAQVNAALLVVVVFFIAREAVLRLQHPQEIDLGAMTLLGALGLAGNLVSARFLHQHAHTNLNVRGAYLEVLADLLASCGVLLAAALTHFLGWRHADAVVSLGIAAFIVPRIWLLLREVTDVLMEAAPRRLDLESLRVGVLDQPGVLGVHDLHVWAITPNRVCLSAHLVSAEGADRDALISAVNRMVRERFNVGHTTLQVEGQALASSGTPRAAEEGCDPCESAAAEPFAVPPARRAPPRPPRA